jgi:hypothetical protein
MTYGMSGFSLNWPSVNPARTEVLGDAIASQPTTPAAAARHVIAQYRHL